ncbi:MAG TPA: transglycosylase domain-containing protein [Flavisolibacter sp.]|nr:transglycosylase domain-containing protein [Flavisolibacter sp.]
MKKSIRIFWIIFISGFSLFLLFFLLVFFGVFGALPTMKQLENPSILQSSEIYATDGTLMGKYYREHGNRSNVNYRDISKHVINALVATEDFRFYDHSGIDYKRTLKAMLTLGKDGGGSTITQQLAKNLLDQGSKNRATRIVEKIKEYIVAIRLERNFTKEEILALYLNAVPFGDNVYGIRNASRTFFQKEPDRLNPNEAALLVGMLKGNYLYNPRVHPTEAKARRNVVLNLMAKNGYISEAEAEQYKLIPIRTNYRKLDENNGYAPYFREVLKDELKDALKDARKSDGEPYDIYDDGLRIFTTINPKMQQYAEESVGQQMPSLQRTLNQQHNIKNGSVWKGHENVLEAAMENSDRWNNLKDDGWSDDEIKATFHQKVAMKVFAWNAKRETDTVMTPLDSIKYTRQMVQTAFMVMEPVTGEVRAWVGGISFKTYKLDHAQLKTKRQVGSSIKPFLYCQAIEEHGFTPETQVIDEQQTFGKNQLVPATTKSCSGRTMTMASALAYSKNCATAYIMKQVGPSQFASFLEKINIPTHVQPYPSIALGACELSLYEMMWGYTLFPGHGFSTKPLMINRIEDRNGNVIKRFDFSTARKEAVSEATAYQMCKMLEGPVTKGTAAGLMQALGAKEMGGKTGTTNDNADAWFFGFTPQLLAGAWVGSDDRFIHIESAQGFGGAAARPIWQAFFKKIYADKTLGIDKDAEFVKPPDMQNGINDADMMRIIDNLPPDAQGDNNTNNANDYSLDSMNNNIPPESQAPIDENNQPKKDKPKKDTTKTKIGEMSSVQPEKKKKEGFFRRLFGNKNKENSANDY